MQQINILDTSDLSSQDKILAEYIQKNQYNQLLEKGGVYLV